MTTRQRTKDAVLLVGTSGFIKKRIPTNLHVRSHEAKSFKKASKILKEQPIKIILTDDLGYFEKLKRVFPNPVRILMVDDLNLHITQQAINRGEVFRLIPQSATTKEISEALYQGIQHYNILSDHRHLIQNLKKQNQSLEGLIQKLEREVAQRTTQLRSIEDELQISRRSLEQLNDLIAWINASTTKKDLEERVNSALKQILPLERVILSQKSVKRHLKDVRSLNRPTVVVPLFYQKRNLGHLYLECKSDESLHKVKDRLDLIKQVSDTVALTLEKIQILEVSIKRKEEWEQTFDAIKDPVSLVDQNYTIIRANLAYSKISNTKIQHLVGRKCYEVFQKRDTPCEGCQLQESLKHRKPKNFELKSSAQDTYYATSAFPTLPYIQNLGVMYYRDQGEERRLRDRLIQSEKMAEIGILAGSVAHELNNPLGGILAYTQILISEVEPKSSIQADLKEIEKAAIRSKNIVENLLYFSRVSKRGEQQPVDLIEAIEKALSLIHFKFKHKGLRIQTDLSKVPLIRGDFNQLVQVFLNIFQNSIEAIKNRGQVNIRTHYNKDDRRVFIEIDDTGTGVNPSELSKIFNPFFTTKNKSLHPGLGLAVGYQIIKDHGGEVKAESEVGKGTKFVTSFPIFLKKIT